MERIFNVLRKIDGYKTYTGLIIATFGMVGLTRYVTNEELAVILDCVFKIVGVLLAAIGAWHKDYKIQDSDF